MIKFTTKFLFLFFLFSCQGKHPQNNLIQLDLELSEKGKFSDMFSETNYLFLDMGETEVLARPYHILFGPDKIIVEDRDLSNIHIFNTEGKLISSIKSSHSEGPGTIKQSEYIQLKGDKIYVYDVPLSKTAIFDLNGKFIGEKKESLRFEAFYNFENSRVLFNGLNDLQQGKIFINQDLSSSNDTTLLYSYPNDYYWVGIGSKDGFMEDQSSDDIYFNIPYSYEIIQFDNQGDIKQTYEFDLGSRGISHEERFRLAENRDLKKHLAENRLINSIHSFFPVKDHFFMYLYQQDYNLKPTHHFLVFDREMNLLHQTFNPINDLDGMIIGGVPWTFHENKIYFIVNSINFYNSYIEKFSGQKVEIKAGNVHDFFQKHQEQLKDDQTVLVSLTLKDKIE